MTPNIKIYQCYHPKELKWIIADTEEEALTLYIDITKNDDKENIEVTEIPKEIWDSRTVTICGEKITCTEWVNKYLAILDEVKEIDKWLNNLGNNQSN